MSTIAAGTTSGTALVSTGNTAGTLVFQTNGTTTALTLGTDQTATFAGAVTAPSFSGTSSTATNLAGGSNGTIPYQSAAGTTQMLAVGTAGQLLQTNGVGAPSWATVSAGFTLATPVASTSGTSIDFTGIPAGVKQIVISFVGVSTSSTSNKIIRLGDAGGFENADYSCSSVYLTSAGNDQDGNATGFFLKRGNASDLLSGAMILTLENATSFTWSCIATFNPFNGGLILTSGSKSLSQQLNSVRITTIIGSDTFDAGEINIAYI